MIWLFFYVYGSLAALQPLYWAATQPSTYLKSMPYTRAADA